MMLFDYKILKGYTENVESSHFVSFIIIARKRNAD